MNSSVPLVCITRSGVADTVHCGSAVAVDTAGTVLWTVGDAEARAYMRSAEKPIQAIPVLASGAVERFGLDEADVGIICGSHRGGPDQVAQVRSILAKCGLDETLLQSGTGIADNCSGKHAGMLAACRHQGLRLDNYTDPAHPHQAAVLRALNEVCNLSAGEAHVGIDGCSAPIHWFSIRKMALGYARMSVPGDSFDRGLAGIVRRITEAMWAAPDGHTGEPLYRTVFGPTPRLLTKIGGNGVYCGGLAGRGIGFAAKVDDGSSMPLLPVFTRFLREMGGFTAEELAQVEARFWRRVDNRRGAIVGTIEVLLA